MLWGRLFVVLAGLCVLFWRFQAWETKAGRLAAGTHSAFRVLRQQPLVANKDALLTEFLATSFLAILAVGCILYALSIIERYQKGSRPKVE